MASIRKHTVSPRRSVGALVIVLGLVAFATAGVSGADQHVGLGTAGSFAVLAGTGVTNTGPTVVTGDLGTCPTPAITGFPPGDVNGTIHANDALACGAKDDLTIAYNDAAGRAPTPPMPVRPTLAERRSWPASTRHPLRSESLGL